MKLFELFSGCEDYWYLLVEYSELWRNRHERNHLSSHHYGEKPPVCLRACASAKKAASTENWFTFWAKDWPVIVCFVGIIYLWSYNFQWNICVAETPAKVLTQVTKHLILLRIFPFSKNSCLWDLCTQKLVIQRPGCFGRDGNQKLLLFQAQNGPCFCT